MSNGKYCITYNLTLIKGIGIILPSACICDLDIHGLPYYMRGVANFETVASYGIEVKGSEHEELLKLCEELTVEELEKGINRNRKQLKSINTLFDDKKLQSTLQGIIDRKMEKVLNIIKAEGYFLGYNIVRKVRVSDFLLHFHQTSISPDLLFSKTQTGIKYELNLVANEKSILPHKHNIEILSDRPAILLIDRSVCWMDHLNALKVKPFLKKDSVFIKSDMVRTFFEAFLKDVMGKVDIRSEGFEILRKSQILGKTLFFVFDIFENRWLLDITFDYGTFRFKSSEKSRRRTSLSLDVNHEVVITECTRDEEQEQKVFQVLHELGFVRSSNMLFEFGIGKFDVIHNISLFYNELKVIFNITPPDVDGKVLSLQILKVMPDFVLVNDWFDLRGAVSIGDIMYPISALFRNIRQDDPYFRLKDGSYVLIPEEIRAKYESIVRFGIESNDTWKIQKQHFTLLGQDEMLSSKDIILDAQEIDYQPSHRLKAILRSYQMEGVKWLIKHRVNGLGACLADDMGLGKTLQTIAVLLSAKEELEASTVQHGVAGIQLDLFGSNQNIGRNALCALIVVPASLVFNWYSEIKKYAPSLQTLMYTGPQRSQSQRTMMAYDIIITTYYTALSDFEWLKTKKFTYIVLDESQQIRNKDSKIFKSIRALDTKYKISLSGTPIENSLADLWSQMEFINPMILGSYSFFRDHFQLPIEKFKSEKAIIELKKLVDPFILRRTKEQVAKDLPELIEDICYVEMTPNQAKYYEKQKSAARNHLLGLNKGDGQYRFHVLSSLLKLRQIANHPFMTDKQYDGESGKFVEVQEKVLSIIKSGNKVLIFSSFVAHLELFVEWLTKQSIDFALLTGGMAATDREKNVKRFQDDPGLKVFLLSIKAGGTGLNLTAADYVFILDPWWNPFVEKQAVARAHRIGRTNNVIVSRFISKNTIEEKIMKLQSIKKSLSDDILDLEDFNNISNEELEDLL